MSNLPEKVKNNLAFIVEQAGLVDTLASTGRSGEKAQLDLSLSELALFALMTADALENTKDRSNFLLYDEIARRLRDIALLCMDAQECGDAAALPALLHRIRAKADALAELAGLPKYEPPAETGLVPVSVSVPAPKKQTSALALHREVDPSERLRAEVHALRELLASLVLERDNLVNVELRDIEAAYLRELGGLEAEAYQAECEVRILKAKLEQMQARLNREKPVQEEEIDDNIRARYEEYKRIYEEFVKKIFEAAAYHQKREKQRKQAPDAAQESNRGDQTHQETHDNTGNETPPDAPDSDAPDSALEESEEQELRRLYRRIVKALHPDLHPNQDEAAKNLLKRAIVAYKEFDLTTLREIAAMLDGDAPENSECALDALRKEKARLLELIRVIRAEIRNIKSRYPYTMKDLLDNPVRLAEEKEKLTARIDRARRAAEIYQGRIEEILKNGRTDPATERT